MFCLDDDGTVDTQRERVEEEELLLIFRQKKLERFSWLFVKTKTKTKKEEKQTSTIGLFFWGTEDIFEEMFMGFNNLPSSSRFSAPFRW